MLVEPGGAAHFERLLRGGRAPSHDPTVGRQGRPRPQGHILLRPLPSTARGHEDKVRRRQARELHNHAVSLVVLRGPRKSWQEDPASYLGQRKLAHLQGGEAMARQTQPRSEGERLWGEDRQLPSPETESVAELHRAEMGSWQAQGRGVRWTAGHVRTRREGVRGVWLSPSRASHHPTGGRLIMHYAGREQSCGARCTPRWNSNTPCQ